MKAENFDAARMQLDYKLALSPQVREAAKPANFQGYDLEMNWKLVCWDDIR